MNQSRINPVILLGGSGSRLWPYSSQNIPKQFKKSLNQEKYSLFQESLLRVSNLNYFHTPIVVTSIHNKEIAIEQAEKICINIQLVIEPIPMNTGPACIVASMLSMLNNNDHVAILSADQHFAESDFMDKIYKKIYFDKESLYLLGKVPDAPNVNYGYIKVDSNINAAEDYSEFKVEEFIEKPKKNIAESLIANGKNLWNLGTFIFNPELLLNDMDPSVIKLAKDAIKDYDFSKENYLLYEGSFAQLPKKSLDYLWVESYQSIKAILLKSNWYDLGSFHAMLESVKHKDDRGNFSTSPSIHQNTKNSLFISNKKIVSNNVSNLLICESNDAIYISNIDKADDIKNIREKNKNFFQQSEPVSLGKFYRPWGWYKTISFDKGYQVKILHVKPMQKLSLQMHYHRSEHWVVLTGQATVILNKDAIELKKDEGIYIEKETKHSLQNLTKEPLEVIELQIGDYLGEDDIVRFSDIYGRI